MARPPAVTRRPTGLRALAGTRGYAALVLLVVGAVVIYLVASGTFDLGGGEEEDVLATPAAVNDPGETAAPAPTEGAADAGVALAGLREGEAFQYGDLRLALTDVRRGGSVGAETDVREARGRFLTLFLTSENTGRTPLGLAGNALLVDGDGRAFAPDAAATALAARFDAEHADGLSTPLQPGLRLDLLLVFDVPKDAEGLRLRLSGGYVDVALEE